jgi:hypothetical protein
MRRALHVAQLVGLNAVPVVGVVGGGWSSATALALYWCETVLLAALIAVRIELHRQATRKRGHYLAMNITSTTGGRTTRRQSVLPYSVFFVLAAVLSAAAQGIFLFFVLRQGGLLASVRPDDMAVGLRAVALFVALGFLIDLIGLRDRPFAWINAISLRAARRMLVVQMVIIIGVVAVGWLGAPEAVLIAFVVFKLLTDIGSQLPEYNPRHAPAWLVRLLGAGFAEHWRRERRQEDAQAAAEEEVFAGVPMPAKKPAIELTRY